MVVWTSVAVLLGAAWITKSPAQPQCRCFPGDSCWPSSAEWDSFNKTLGGKLIATVPIASPCHDGFPGVSYDADKCAQIQANWARPELHDQTTHSPMAAFFANLSCDPFTPRDAQCTIGAYVPYAVNASSAEDYRRTAAFATTHNIRLVIRNTGHDYMGKSTGAGALALWTHNIKDRSILDYESAAYTGKAMKIGAGVQASEAQETANAQGLVVVEGDCPTVGIAGGYIQGGGTSPLASKFGLAVDQVLEWEVVTAAGNLLRAAPDQNPDLYWALAGGGGGAYGMVLSVTVKLHPNMPTAGATLSFTESSDKYWDIIQTFLSKLPAIVEAGATVYWQAIPGNLFLMPQSYFPNGTAQDLELLLKPTLEALNQSQIPYKFSSQEYPTFQDSFHAMNPEMNISEVNLGGRIIPRSLVASENAAASLSGAIKSITDNGSVLAGVSMDVSRQPTSPNSANPVWRESLFLAFLGTMYDRVNMTANLVGQHTVTNVLDPALEKLTPGGGAYLNEADFNQPNWQEVFYGQNYPKLLAIKKKYDPNGIFWGPTVVGSEAWKEAADGRLCMTAK
ncbi:FAD binding domain protein [Annulohypoxylon maeteangense]|uniref:FAD binding domain protein n=1 Tax=Annulohypoxylon maeteangense TaxID=1927788 RepID=UPI0020083357|nr:FAD binding domain protein [Annulohypoxylon maeteangense]KAI0890644.1 FAD binding domain protein [Annulohypoxylon maeteangense]